MTSSVRAFDPLGPLSPGVTLLEASAGTGKTYQITTLFLRLVAEVGLPAESILVVTFTNAATAELRDRIRCRLGEAVRLLEGSLAGEAPPGADPLLAALTGVAGPGGVPLSSDVRGERLERLRGALSDFDVVPISTIHGFCARVLDENAFEGGVEADLELLEDAGPLLDELVADHVSQTLRGVDELTVRFLREGAGLTVARLTELARAVTKHPDAPVSPKVEPADGWLAAWRSWRELTAAVAERWRRDSAGLIAQIAAACGPGATKGAGTKLNGRKYQARYTSTNAARLEAWLAEGGLPRAELRTGHPDQPRWLSYFAAGDLAAAAVSGSLSHPLADALQELLDRAADLSFLDGPGMQFAQQVRADLPLRLHARHARTYDDLLREVRDRVVDPEGGEALREALRRRYRAALLDEFQDTDDVQWEVFRAVFADDPAAYLVLIGDPKQAIYAFRGADVHTYARAVEATAPERRSSLGTNQRSDAGLVAAVNALFADRPGVFDLPFIAYESVASAPRNAGLRYRPGRATPPLLIRWLDAPGLGLPDAKLPLPKGAATPRVVARLAADVAAQVAGDPPTLLVDRDGALRPLTARDVAVLVRTNRQALLVKEALLAVGLRAVVARSGSVFESPMALAVQRLLEALAEPEREGPSRVLAVSDLLAWDAATLCPLDDGGGSPGACSALSREGAGAACGENGRSAQPVENTTDSLLGCLPGGGPPDPQTEPDSAIRYGLLAAWETLRADVRRWAGVAETDGVAAALRRVCAEREVDLRLARLPDGERRVTDLRHVAELLHLRETREREGLDGLVRWLREQRTGGAADAEGAELRLESDADAVQVLTVHASKGLEFPVVHLPFAWDAGAERRDVVVRWHDPQRRLQLDARLDDTHERRVEALAAAEREARQEELRLLYVALTRARHATVVYWGPLAGADRAALASVLHGGGPGDEVDDRLARAAARVRVGEAETPLYQSLKADLDALVAASAHGGEPGIGWTPVTPVGADAASAPNVPLAPVLAVRDFTRPAPDRQWRRWSYTSLAKRVEAVEIEPAVVRRPADLEARDDDPGGAELDATPALPSLTGPLAGLPGGTDVGRFVHRVFELVDFAALCEKARPHRPLVELVGEAARRGGLADGPWPQRLVEALPALVDTPLGAEVGEACLADLVPSARLDELSFDLPIAGGGAWRPGQPPVDGRDVARCLALRGDDQRVRPQYLRALEAGPWSPLCGFLTGSIDLAARLPTPEGLRWFVLDYKTNRLADYGFAAVRAEMERHHYVLQYHLYLVALHRILAWRVPGYDYDRDVGGAAYLFVRGLQGRSTPRDAEGRVDGVFVDRPPRQVIEGLSSLFDVARGGV